MGKPAPTIYDPMCSVYVLESGEAMLRAHQAQAAEDGRPTPVMYLSTTDFVQHKYEPEEPEGCASLRPRARALRCARRDIAGEQFYRIFI